MIRDYAHNTIDHLKDIINEDNNIVKRYKMNLLEDQQNMGQEKYRDCINYFLKINLDEITHTI